MRTSTVAQVRHAINQGRYDEDVEDLLSDLQEQLEGPDELDFHRIDRSRPLHPGEEDA